MLSRAARPALRAVATRYVFTVTCLALQVSMRAHTNVITGEKEDGSSMSMRETDVTPE